MADTTPAKVEGRDLIRQLLDRNADAVGARLPAGFDPDRFVRLLWTAANTNPELFECDPTSFLAAGIGAAQLGLEPNDARGLCYLIPFRDSRRGRAVQLILGYRGLLDLARRSGAVTAIDSDVVRDGDVFVWRKGTDPTLRYERRSHDRSDDSVIAAFATARVGGDVQFEVVDRVDLDALQSQYGRSDQSPWRTHFPEMARKTALRRLCKLLPQTVQLARAVSYDERDNGLQLVDVATNDEAPALGEGD